MDDETDETTRASRRPAHAGRRSRAQGQCWSRWPRNGERRARRDASARRWRMAGSLAAVAAGLLLTVWWRRGRGPRAVQTAARTATATSRRRRACEPAPSATTHLAASESAGDAASRAARAAFDGASRERRRRLQRLIRTNALTRDPASGLWSGTVVLRPVATYAFIDDSIWMRDPRMPQAHDADFGRPGSVLLVGKP